MNETAGDACSAVTPPRRRITREFILTVATLALAALMLFTHLGTQALWDDEANTALIALGVLRTGDTSAQVDDHNIVAYGNAHELIGLKQRFLPPGQAYIAAGSIALFGRTALGARFDFALLGLATVALILRWMARDRTPFAFRLLLCVALLANVSLFLYCRNARYYAPGIFFTVAIGFCYTARRSILWASLLGLSLLGLLACNYFQLIPAFAVIAADYFIFTRKNRPFTKTQILLLLAIPTFAGLPIVLTWDPLLFTDANRAYRGGWLSDRLLIAYKMLRDIDVTEIAPLPLLILPLILRRWVKNPWLIRGPLLLAIYMVAFVLISPEAPHLHPPAMIRYATAMIPFCITITALALFAVWRLHHLIGTLLAIALAVSNLLFPCSLASFGLTSTQWSFAGELLHPPLDPYTAIAYWINQNVRSGQTIYTLPNYAVYPLMYHAPAPLYAWQFSNPPPAGTPPLDPMQILGTGAPDYIIVFGDRIHNLLPVLQWEATRGYHYLPAETIACTWWSIQRPELFWHSFIFRSSAGPADEIYILRLTAGPPAPAPATIPGIQ